MRALVTGGAGFIGHHLVRGLLDAGHEVVVLDDLSSGDLGRLVEVRERIEVTEGSILDAPTLARAMGSCEVVFHLAAIASVTRSLVDPVGCTTVNVLGTLRVMEAAAGVGVRRVVFASSSATYGIPETLPCRETLRAEPESPYGADKLAAEHYLRTLGGYHGVETACLRYFNVFGPGQDPASEYAAVIPKFVTAILAGHRPTVFGDGTATRDFVHVSNVVRANLLAAAADVPSGSTCNIASGVGTSILDLLRAIDAAIGTHTEPIFAPPRVGDIPHSIADISRARGVLGYRVETGFEAGIQTTVDWYRAKQA